MSSARASVLARVRRALESARREQPPVQTEARATWTDPSWAGDAAGSAAARASFRTRLESVDGHVWQVDDQAALERVFTRILTAAAPRKIAVSDSASACALVQAYARTRPQLEVLPWSAGRAALVEADVGVSLAQLGIAETGTLVLESSAEHHRLVSLLPAVHIALLPASAILGTLGQALAAVRDGSGAVRSRTITFVTGPSRTADIELTLVVGVHGPKELHVILTPEKAS